MMALITASNYSYEVAAFTLKQPFLQRRKSKYSVPVNFFTRHLHPALEQTFLQGGGMSQNDLFKSGITSIARRDFAIYINCMIAHYTVTVTPFA